MNRTGKPGSPNANAVELTTYNNGDKKPAAPTAPAPGLEQAPRNAGAHAKPRNIIDDAESLARFATLPKIKIPTWLKKMFKRS